ncbi:MAG: toxin-antitoxin system YwqK family antitoxin [Bacteroidetes bacterium]|nr:MAG: toxin-antitoxin system YwqK family antitoxin [Bacteroidota bacterium]REK08069.1 MAG: toxin-antitoxin system YwqK family antitoxin [Bacteroidota bacterium]REK32274.1 MAG: toxin-antitoxin system YwqK family antitoxin [Bacteroidota bacterium]REK47426.1 MAG: toxin-antitoxin system YwqK family antitoxin [Bacteroidota bacterium]
MYKIRLIGLLLLSGMSFTRLSLAQSFEIFKGDTINRTDKRGLKQGAWKKFYPGDMIYFEGIYKDDKALGALKYYHKNGKVKTLLNSRAVKGEYFAEFFSEEGKMIGTGKYFNQEKDSVWNYFDSEGRVNSTEIYVKGKKEGVWKVYYVNGKLARELMYKNDRKNGPYREYFDSGKLKIQATYKNDEFTGIATVFHPDGKIWQKGSYVNGLKEGAWDIFDVNGKLERQELYKQGNLQNPQEDK